MKILVADPAKNITVFVLDPVEDLWERAALARAILAEKSLGAEQVGFVVPPESGPGARQGLWHLEMAGGEFCGNAARCLGLYVARQQGIKGKAEIFVSISGAEEPVRVEVDTVKSLAAAEMPKPQAMETLDYDGHPLSVLVFEGITHIIAPGTEAEAEAFYAIKALAEKELVSRGKELPAALGVMFFNTAAVYVRPAIYVRSIDTLVFESSCGSGSAALGIWLSRSRLDGTFKFALNQPGGVIETKLIKKAGEITSLTIGGEVKLGEVLEY